MARKRHQTRTVEGASCRLDERGQVVCEFELPKRSRVLNPSPSEDQPSGLPPRCSVDLATGKWTCPGHPQDGRDADVRRVWTDEVGHSWALAGPSEVTVPAVRGVAVGAVDPLAQPGTGMSWPEYQRRHPNNTSKTYAPGRPQQPAHQRQRSNKMNNQYDQNGVDVGSCNPYLGPGALANCNLPLLSNNIAPDCSVYQECMVPFGFNFAVSQDGTIYPPEFAGVPKVEADSVNAAIGNKYLAYAPRGIFSIQALRIFQPSSAGLVAIDSLITGDTEIRQLDTIDATAFQTDDCGCYFPAGCFSTTNALEIEARSINGTEEDILELCSGVCWCTRQAAINSCGPIATCPSVVPFGPVNMAQPVAVSVTPAA